MARSQSRELIAMGDVEWISGDDKCVGALLHKACEDGIEGNVPIDVEIGGQALPALSR